ncbi:MAG: sugar ABC transporter permease, partial [Nitrospinae bacterium]|nr:sugar ABC transporter permease [Nitrospinota bacterium]
AFQAFSSIYGLTGDGRGPLDTTQNLTVYLYSNFYEYGRLGYGSTIAVILCFVLVMLTLVQWRVARSRVHYT